MSTLTAVVSPQPVRRTARTNYWALLAAVAAAFVFSSVYYSLFADLWLELRRLNPTSGAEVSPSPLQPLVELVRTLVVAYVVARLVGHLQIADWKRGLRLGATLWLAFPGMLWLGAIAWENTPWQLAALHAGDWLFKCLLFAVLPSVWRR